MFEDKRSSSPSPAPKQVVSWRSVADIVHEGFERSPIVMANEFHNGMLRCIRTREVGRDIILAAHQSGCRTLAAEALGRGEAEILNNSRTLPASPPGSYLSQPDMRQMLQVALDLGWSVAEYEADFMRVNRETEIAGHMAGNNLRESLQAQNLVKVLTQHNRVLVWCGNSHHCKVERGDWIPMGIQFWRAARVEPFCIDQSKTVNCYSADSLIGPHLIERYRKELQDRGGVAAFLASEGPPELIVDGSADAYIYSLKNDLE